VSSERAWEIWLSVSLKSPTDYGVLAQEGKTDFALNNPRMRTCYKVWVLDNESNKSAYSGGTGTYVGEKSIFLI
jgi:hypothetical protein